MTRTANRTNDLPDFVGTWVDHGVTLWHYGSTSALEWAGFIVTDGGYISSVYVTELQGCRPATHQCEMGMHPYDDHYGWSVRNIQYFSETDTYSLELFRGETCVTTLHAEDVWTGYDTWEEWCDNHSVKVVDSLT